MSEWGWVLAGYVIAYGSMTAYLGVLWRRRSRLNRQAPDRAAASGPR